MRTLLLGLVARVILFGLLTPILWLVEPIWRFRLTHLWCARFGPLAYNTHLFLGRLAVDGPERRTTRIFFGAKPANRQLFEMWKREIPILESRILSALYHYGGPRVVRSRFFAPLAQDMVSFRALDTGPMVSFTADEEHRGRSLLKKMGLGSEDWFICFQGRDSLYHHQRADLGDSGTHRNVDVLTYLKAARHVTSLGGYALRVGAVAEAPLPPTANTRIIDYAHGHRSDFGDIYLLGRCRFLLGCSTGTNSLPPLFSHPTAQANTLPLRPVPMGRQSLYIPVFIHRQTDDRRLTFTELETLGAYEYHDRAKTAAWEYPGGLERLGLRIVVNDEDDILDLCLDMLDQLEGRPPDPQAVAIQRWYKSRFFGDLPEVDFAPNMGPRFILKHRHLFAE